MPETSIILRCPACYKCCVRSFFIAPRTYYACACCYEMSCHTEGNPQLHVGYPLSDWWCRMAIEPPPVSRERGRGKPKRAYPDVDVPVHIAAPKVEVVVVSIRERIRPFEWKRSSCT